MYYVFYNKIDEFYEYKFIKTPVTVIKITLQFTNLIKTTIDIKKLHQRCNVPLQQEVDHCIYFFFSSHFYPHWCYLWLTVHYLNKLSLRSNLELSVSLKGTAVTGQTDEEHPVHEVTFWVSVWTCNLCVSTLYPLRPSNTWWYSALQLSYYYCLLQCSCQSDENSDLSALFIV